ncbi:MAG: ligase-associated DNA damage response endonuclease PdeM, partial [Burkholderiales bacterium]
MLPPEGVLDAEAGGERLWLLPECAAFWPRERTLLVADAHIGKDAAFRRAGLAVPRGPTGDDLARLAVLIERYRPARIVFLGDLMHNRAARDAAGAAFIEWRTRCAQLDIVLVRGNHDRHAGDPGCEWNVHCVDEPYVVRGLALCHVPREFTGRYVIAGHVHPAARLNGRGRDSLRLPCFLFTESYAIMPAFGSF